MKAFLELREYAFILKRSTEYLAQYMREKKHIEQISHGEISEQHGHTHTHTKEANGCHNGNRKYHIQSLKD